jgi:hypothetical protein
MPDARVERIERLNKAVAIIRETPAGEEFLRWVEEERDQTDEALRSMGATNREWFAGRSATYTDLLKRFRPKAPR